MSDSQNIKAVEVSILTIQQLKTLLEEVSKPVKGIQVKHKTPEEVKKILTDGWPYPNPF
jgi:hypothetical protein